MNGYICKLLMNYRENTNIDVSVFMFELRMINYNKTHNIYIKNALGKSYLLLYNKRVIA
jgi:hypothetical protein